MWMLWVVGIAACLAALWFFTPLPVILNVRLAVSDIHGVESRMQYPSVCLQVATNLALYCQSREELHLTNGFVRGPVLPAPLPSFGSPLAIFQSNSALITFGGGFYHYGYRLELNEALSSKETNLWELSFCREEQPAKFLCRVALATSNRFNPREFASNTIAEYDRGLGESPRDITLQKEKLSFMLEFEPNGIPASLTKAIRAAPDYWWPRLTLALFATGRNDKSDAAQEFKKFTESNPSYSSYLYLAYFYHQTGKPRDAAAAIEKAITFPIVDRDDDEGNSEFRGYAAGVSAFRNGDYKTVIKLCDALLPIRENGLYAKPALRDLKSAAESAIAGSRVVFKPSDDLLKFNPYNGNDLQRLLSK
jgi:tetratricopeptide (TPR) repeat protein